MKKILALLLALVMLVGTLAGCTGEPQSGDPVGSQTQAPTTTDGSGLNPRRIRQMLPMSMPTNQLSPNPSRP